MEAMEERYRIVFNGVKIYWSVIDDDWILKRGEREAKMVALQVFYLRQ